VKNNQLASKDGCEEIPESRTNPDSIKVAHVPYFFWSMVAVVQEQNDAACPYSIQVHA
jgi:hypothetical protein